MLQAHAAKDFPPPCGNWTHSDNGEPSLPQLEPSNEASYPTPSLERDLRWRGPSWRKREICRPPFHEPAAYLHRQVGEVRLRHRLCASAAPRHWQIALGGSRRSAHHGPGSRSHAPPPRRKGRFSRSGEETRVDC